MKKVLSIILAGMMTVSLTACGNNATTEKAETNKEVATEGNYSFCFFLIFSYFFFFHDF